MEIIEQQKQRASTGQCDQKHHNAIDQALAIFITVAAVLMRGAREIWQAVLERRDNLGQLGQAGHGQPVQRGVRQAV